MSTRLTNAARDNIVARVMAYKFEKSDADMRAEEAKAFDRIMDLLQGEYKTLLDTVPGEYLRTTLNIRVAEVMPNSRRGYFITGNYPRAVSAEFPQWRALDDETASPEALAAATAAANKRAAYEDEKEELKNKLEALVYSVNSYKKLYAIWPELAEIIPMETPDIGATALTVDVKELNRMIPLPKQREAA